ncbi:hypothetical protein ABZ330_08240 [Streptomyces sp. NPDC006172]|uniref:hypothetical protein n=1 Tax=Streptomyces sp. NPDC006172 TaxID=3154470 RepID=UPI00340DF694
MNSLPTPHLLAALPGAAALLLSIGAVTPAEAGIPADRLRPSFTGRGDHEKIHRAAPKPPAPDRP